MRWSVWSSVSAALVASAAAAKTSPLVVISAKNSLPQTGSAADQDFSVGAVESNVLFSAVEDCNYDAYMFVEVPGFDVRTANKAKMPFFSKLAREAAGMTALSSVVDTDAYEGAAESYVLDSCGAKAIAANSDGSFDTYTDITPRLITATLSESASASEHDEIISHMVSRLVSPNFLLVLRTAGSGSGSGSDAGVAVDEPASVAATGAASPDYAHLSGTELPEGSLFDKYQFFSPGIWMGTIVGLLILTLIITALDWLGSLRVTYRAVEKQETKQ